MPSISETLSKLQHLKNGLRFNTGGTDAGRLVPLAAFGRNPGDLRALLHVPADLEPGAPLVVVLHGCTQTAAAYDHGSGWSALADRFGFAVLYPEQQRSNNANLCFNWFEPEDTRRGGGEAESIREMIAVAVERHRLDTACVFVTGLSAGGAMTSVMLATYPEVFAGGAIIAGLPYGTAAGVPEALKRMRGRGYDRASLGAKVRGASAHRGSWPTVSVWHGTADATVDPLNAAMIVEQWRSVHGVTAPAHADRVDDHLHRTWRNPAGRVVIEEYAIAGLGHGTPIATAGEQACGVPGPHMLEAGISSTYRIAASWGLVPAGAEKRRPSAVSDEAVKRDRDIPAAKPSFDPGRVINDALRSAGLVRR